MIGADTMPAKLPPVFSTPVAAPVSERATRIVAAQNGPSFSSIMKNVAINASTAAYGAETLTARSSSRPANGSEIIGTSR